MYDTVRRNHYWPDMANDRYATLRDCLSYARNGSTNKTQRKLRLFSLSSPLEIFKIDILGPLPNRISRSQCVVLMTDYYLKLTKETLTARTTATTVATFFLKD